MFDTYTTMPAFFYAVTTYNRPVPFGRLLNQLSNVVTSRDQIYVVDDASEPAYVPSNVPCHRMGVREGKEGYWRTVNQALRAFHAWAAAEARVSSAETHESVFVLLQDDVRLASDWGWALRGLFERPRHMDPSPLVVNLHRDGRWEAQPWGKHSGHGPRVGGLRLAGGPHIELYDLGWVDCLFAANRTALLGAFAGGVLPPVSAQRWRHNARLGSGVGPLFSRTFRESGIRIIGTDRSLVRHDGDEPSQMHPDRPADEIANLRTRRFLDDGVREEEEPW